MVHIGFVCNIQSILEDGFNKLLHLAKLPNIEDAIDAILEELGIPNLGLPDISVLDFDFENPFSAALLNLQNQFDGNFLGIDRSMFDPSIKLQQALNSGLDPEDWPVHISTSETGLLNFDCKDPNTYPVVVKAEGFLWSCTHDMSGLHRFPCDLTKPACTNIDYRAFFRCPSPAPAASEEFFSYSPNFSPAYYHAIYYCIPQGFDPEIMPVLFPW